MKYSKSQKPLKQDLEWDAYTDSDCEDDSAGVSGTSKKGRREVGDRAVFIAGSFSACVRFLVSSWVEGNNELPSWKSLFFYRCTDVISFAPLRSQGIDSRLVHIRKVTTPTAPPPCSPKNVYVLANTVRQASVERLAPGTNTSNRARNPTPL